MQALENKRPRREGDDDDNPEAKVRKGEGKASNGARARARTAKVEKPKAKEPVGNVDLQTIISAIVQKVERARAQSSRPHGRPGDLRRRGLHQLLLSGGRGFPGREKEAKVNVKAANVVEKEKAEKVQCKLIRTTVTWATTITTPITIIWW